MAAQRFTLRNVGLNIIPAICKRFTKFSELYRFSISYYPLTFSENNPLWEYNEEEKKIQ